MRRMLTLYLPPAIIRSVWSFFAPTSRRCCASFSFGMAIDRSLGACSTITVPPPRPWAHAMVALDAKAHRTAITLALMALLRSVRVDGERSHAYTPSEGDTR